MEAGVGLWLRERGALGLKGLTRSLHAIGGRIGRGVLAGEVTEARVFMGSTQTSLMGQAILECVKRTSRRAWFQRACATGKRAVGYLGGFLPMTSPNVGRLGRW